MFLSVPGSLLCRDLPVQAAQAPRSLPSPGRSMLARPGWTPSRLSPHLITTPQKACEQSVYLCVLCRVPSHFSCVQLSCDPVGCSPPGFSVHGGSPGKNTGVGCCALLQGIFLTQGSNLCLLCTTHWQAGSLPLAPWALKNILISYYKRIAFVMATDSGCAKASKAAKR